MSPASRFNQYYEENQGVSPKYEYINDGFEQFDFCQITGSSGHAAVQPSGQHRQPLGEQMLVREDDLSRTRAASREARRSLTMSINKKELRQITGSSGNAAGQPSGQHRQPMGEQMLIREDDLSRTRTARRDARRS